MQSCPYLVFTGLYQRQYLVDTWRELSKKCSSIIAWQKVPLKSLKSRAFEGMGLAAGEIKTGMLRDWSSLISIC